MQKNQGESKISRILGIYDGFLHGEVLEKHSLANKFRVDKRTVQRDIQDINGYLTDNGDKRKIIYNPDKKGHELKNRDEAALADSDVYALCKILFDSRAFSDEEMDRLLKALTNGCGERKQMLKIIKNERYHYQPPKHNQKIIDSLWKIIKSIQSQQIASITYEKQDRTVVSYPIRPLGLIFNEYYFYLIGEKCETDNSFAQAFRVDRIKTFDISGKYFSVEDKNRFQEGEFRKKIQFMYTGDLVKITFKFWGDSLEAVLDRLPTAKVIGQEGVKTIVEVEVYGEGVKRWLLSQKDCLEVIKPKWYRDDVKNTIMAMLQNYEN